VLLLGELFANNSYKIAFTMIKWYEYCKSNQRDHEVSEIYGCSQLSILNDYNVVPLDSIM
ncbi:2558_t:CDS:1, partial [Funneliformis geosporum]